MYNFHRESTVIHHDMDIHACSFVSSPRGSTRQHTRCSCRRALDPRYNGTGERLMRAVPAGRAKQRGRFVRLLATGRRGFKILHAAHFVRRMIDGVAIADGSGVLQKALVHHLEPALVSSSSCQMPRTSMNVATTIVQTSSSHQ